MSREDIAQALDEAAEALARAAHALRGSEPDAARASVPASVPAASAAGVPPAPAARPQSTALGMCPVHRVAWTVREGGISKNGKPYRAFWKCSERDENGYCNEKPDPAWAKTHSAEQALTVEDIPF